MCAFPKSWFSPSPLLFRFSALVPSSLSCLFKKIFFPFFSRKNVKNIGESVRGIKSSFLLSRQCSSRLFFPPWPETPREGKRMAKTIFNLVFCRLPKESSFHRETMSFSAILWLSNDTYCIGMYIKGLRSVFNPFIQRESAHPWKQEKTNPLYFPLHFHYGYSSSSFSCVGGAERREIEIHPPTPASDSPSSSSQTHMLRLIARNRKFPPFSPREDSEDSWREKFTEMLMDFLNLLFCSESAIGCLEICTFKTFLLEMIVECLKFRSERAIAHRRRKLS